jgi:lipoprotein-anchoring transpeptidase ErfK/SrfK
VFGLLRGLLLGLLALEVLALAGLGSVRLGGLDLVGEDGSVASSPGMTIAAVVDAAPDPETVARREAAEARLRAFLPTLVDIAKQIEEATPPPPTLEELGAMELATAAPPPGVSFGEDERWIAVNVTTQRATAFVGGQAVRVALVTTGMEGWETPTGDFRIHTRVENETMESTGAGIAIDSPEGYYVENVLFTQYFYGAASLHYNYWRADYYFGNIPSSHGCVGMGYSDALFFWEFADIGTRVVVHE